MRLRLSAVLLLLLAPFAAATSVVPPTFSELVQEADAIYRARVTAVQARRVALADGSGSVIKTFVTLAIERVLKGAEQSEVTLEFLGGAVGDESLIVSGMPKFNLGAREIVFVQKNGVQFCPLVALAHGRYRILRDDATAAERLVRDNGVPLTSPADVELPLATLPAALRAASAAANAGSALTPAAFETSIRAEVERSAGVPQPNRN